MSTLTEIRSYILTQLSGTWNTSNCFYSRMPDEPDFCLTFYQYNGTPSYGLGGSPVLYENIRLQASIRAADYNTAHDAMIALRTVLDAVGGQSLGSTYYHRIMSTDTIIRLEPDNQDRETVVLNFSVMKEPS